MGNYKANNSFKYQHVVNVGRFLGAQGQVEKYEQYNKGAPAYELAKPVIWNSLLHHACWNYNKSRQLARSYWVNRIYGRINRLPALQSSKIVNKSVRFLQYPKYSQCPARFFVLLKSGQY